MASQDRPGGATPDETAKTDSMGSGNNMGGSNSAGVSGDEPMKITAIYDNGGRTLDRYTVVTNELHSGNFRMALAIGNDPADFSQWTGVSVGQHLGSVVMFETLSGKLQGHIARRVFGKDE